MNLPELAALPPERMLLDPDNPRLAALDEAPTSQTEIALALLPQANAFPDETTETVYEQVALNPPLLCPHPEQNGFYTVLDGNIRLTKLKLRVEPELRDAARATKQQIGNLPAPLREYPRSVPCFIYENAAAAAKARYQRHNRAWQGAWDARATVRHLSQVLDTSGSGATLSAIANRWGMPHSTAYWTRLLTAQRLLEQLADWPAAETGNLARTSRALVYADIAGRMDIPIAPGSEPALHPLPTDRMTVARQLMRIINGPPGARRSPTAIGDETELEALARICGREDADRWLSLLEHDAGGYLPSQVLAEAENRPQTGDLHRRLRRLEQLAADTLPDLVQPPGKGSVIGVEARFRGDGQLYYAVEIAVRPASPASPGERCAAELQDILRQAGYDNAVVMAS